MPGLMAEENEHEIKQGLQAREKTNTFLRDNNNCGKNHCRLMIWLQKRFMGETFDLLVLPAGNF